MKVLIALAVFIFPAVAGCQQLPSLNSLLDRLADPATGRILHTERTISPEAAIDNDGVYFGGVDYAPQKFGGQTFWLPSQFDARDVDAMGRISATYSDCHRYTGELKILPDASPVGAGSQSR